LPPRPLPKQTLAGESVQSTEVQQGCVQKLTFAALAMSVPTMSDVAQMPLVQSELLVHAQRTPLHGPASPVVASALDPPPLEDPELPPSSSPPLLPVLPLLAPELDVMLASPPSGRSNPGTS
jgi:hypothetical protein